MAPSMLVGHWEGCLLLSTFQADIRVEPENRQRVVRPTRLFSFIFSREKHGCI